MAIILTHCKKYSNLFSTVVFGGPGGRALFIPYLLLLHPAGALLWFFGSRIPNDRRKNQWRRRKDLKKHLFCHNMNKMKISAQHVGNDQPTPQTENTIFLLDGIHADPRQRRKIVRSFDNPGALWNHDVTLSEKEEEIFLHEIARRELNEKENVDKQFQRLIAMITGNILHLKCKPMFEAVKNDSRLMGILQHFLPATRSKEEITDISILRFLMLYPDAYGFQHHAAHYLEEMARRECGAEHREFRDAMRCFMEIIYGKQFEYLMQINLLRTEAKRIYIRELRRLRAEMETIQLRVMEPHDSDEILEQTELHGGPTPSGYLNIQTIAESGLKPIFRLIFREKVMACFSHPYCSGHNRQAVIAYLPRRGKYIARSYYLSISHGVWRFLDAYMMIAGKTVAYGKGGKHAAVNLPLIFQKSLASLMSISKPPLQLVNGEHIFTGLAKNALHIAPESGDHAYTDSWLPDAPPQKLYGNFYPPEGKRIPPQEVVFRDPGQVPDFSKIIISWDAPNPAYGSVHYDACLSMDDRLIYTFCRDPKNRRWISNIENHSPIVSTGLRQVWVDGGDLATPAFEYYAKTAGYGDYELRWGLYIDMFKNYLSQVFFINNPR